MSEKYLSAYRKFQKVTWFGMIFSGSVIFFMMLYSTLDVVLRNTTGTSYLYAYEFSQNYLMPFAVFPGLAYTFKAGVMPRIEFIITKFHEKHQRTVAILLIVIEIVLLLLLTVYGWQYTMDAFTKGLAFTAGGMDFPRGPAILFAPLGFLLVTAEMVFLLIKNIKSHKPSFTVLEEKPSLNRS